MKRILKIAIDTILYVVIAILLCYIVLKATNKIGIYKVLTGSMEDGIHTGDYIIVKHTKDLEVGDIVTYKRSNYYITHRIIELDKERGKLITKGDANNIEDDPAVDMSEVVGKCMYKSALIKFIITYKFVLIFLFLILFSASTILGILTKKEKEKSNLLENDNDENNIEKNEENKIEETNEKLESEIIEEAVIEEASEIDENKEDIAEETVEEVVEEATEENKDDINEETTEEVEDNPEEVEETVEKNKEESNLDNEDEDLKKIKEEIDDIYNVDESNGETDNIYNVDDETMGDDISEEKDDNNSSNLS